MSFFHRRVLVPALLLAGVAPAGTLSAAASDEFRWKGRGAEGRTIEIKGVNGEVVARPSSGSEVEVEAHKRGRKSDPATVEIKVIEHPSGVTICAVYPARSSAAPNECRAGSEGRMNTSDNDVNVDFEVLVPAGVRFVGRTVNGGVEALDLPSDVEAYTVNGGVKVEAAGEARAETVNGSIRASMGRADGQSPLVLKTVNGSISVELPSTASADVHAQTVNGGIETDFPLTVKGRFVGKRMNGTIGGGGRQLELSTVNGSIALRHR